MSNTELINKVAWKDVLVVDLPFAPFQPQDKTEKKIIDYVANRMLQIARDEKRIKYCEGDTTDEIDKHFTQSEKIVAIDTANITWKNLSYLDYVFYITRVHPCVLINCNIIEDELKGLKLHSDLIKHNYILPIFNRVQSMDMISSKNRYGDKFLSLVRGEVQSINLADIDEMGKLFSEKDFLSHFSQLSIHGSKIGCDVQITWLGLDSGAIANCLTDLFNKNEEYFELEKVCSDYDINVEEFKQYLGKNKCMLFGKGRKPGEIQFRLLKRYFYPKLMHSLMHQFEEKLIEAGAIDATHGGYPGQHNGEGKTIEYHSLGNIFQANDTFSCKLLCYANQCLGDVEFDTVVVVDNGKEKGLYDLVKHIFNVNEENVIRIVNYFSEPIVYPFDKLKPQSKVVIITDLINTGSLLNKVCHLLLHLNEDVVLKGVFSFIIRDQLLPDAHN